MTVPAAAIAGEHVEGGLEAVRQRGAAECARPRVRGDVVRR